MRKHTAGKSACIQEAKTESKYQQTILTKGDGHLRTCSVCTCNPGLKPQPKVTAAACMLNKEQIILFFCTKSSCAMTPGSVSPDMEQREKETMLKATWGVLNVKELLAKVYLTLAFPTFPLSLSHSHLFSTCEK